MNPEEMVLCVPTRDVDCHVPVKNGMYAPGPDVIHEVASAILGDRDVSNAKLVRRGDCETDESLTQIVTYGVVIDGADMLCYGRSERGDSRLIKKRSVGVGGHVIRRDAVECAIATQPRSSIGVLLAARRELREELGAKRTRECELVGLIRDLTNPVGRVHLGFAYRVVLDPKTEIRACDEIIDPTFMNPLDIIARYSSRMNEKGVLESWSEIVLANLDRFGFGKL